MAVVAALHGVIVLAVWAALLVHADMTRRRLPDPLTLPPAGAGVLTVAITEPALLPAGLAWAGLYLGLGMFGGGIGGGDVKLAVVLGMVLGVVGGFPVVLLAVVLAGLSSAAAMTVSRSSSMAHGPSMFVATGTACAIALLSGWA